MSEQPDLFTPPASQPKNALETVMDLARRIYNDDPEIAVSHLGAEVCRATCGVGRYALQYPKSTVTS